MAFRVVLQPRAERDIEEAFSYIYDQAPPAAFRWYARVRAQIESLSEMPMRCAIAPEAELLQFELRQLTFGKRTGRYRIVFRLIEESNQVDVLAVRHGSRGPILAHEID